MSMYDRQLAICARACEFECRASAKRCQLLYIHCFDFTCSDSSSSSREGPTQSNTHL